MPGSAASRSGPPWRTGHDGARPDADGGRADGLPETLPDGPTGASLGLTGCRACGLTAPLDAGRCPRCGARLVPPETRSTQAVWAYLVAGIIAYIPANTYPMLVTRTLGRAQESTIIGGAIDLAAHGSWFVAAVVFTASVVIPILKFTVIAYIAHGIARGSARHLHEKLHLHHLVELIGRWSMIDVFVVAVLAALVQLGALASIDPGPAAGPFALSVILTMLAAQSLDARTIWAAGERRPETGR